jgi:hypothetical protein
VSLPFKQWQPWGLAANKKETRFGEKEHVEKHWNHANHRCAIISPWVGGPLTLWWVAYLWVIIEAIFPLLIPEFLECVKEILCVEAPHVKLYRSTAGRRCLFSSSVWRVLTWNVVVVVPCEPGGMMYTHKQTKVGNRERAVGIRRWLCALSLMWKVVWLPGGAVSNIIQRENCCNCLLLAPDRLYSSSCTGVNPRMILSSSFPVPRPVTYTPTPICFWSLGQCRSVICKRRRRVL